MVGTITKEHYLSPHPPLMDVRENGLYLKAGSTLNNGTGLLLTSNSPSIDIPILRLLQREKKETIFYNCIIVSKDGGIV